MYLGKHLPDCQRTRRIRLPRFAEIARKISGQSAKTELLLRVWRYQKIFDLGRPHHLRKGEHLAAESLELEE